MKWLTIVFVFLFLLTESCNLLINKPDSTQEKTIAKHDEANIRLHDIWVVTHIQGMPLGRSVDLPRVEIYVKDKRVMGFDGCNEFQGPIEELTSDKLVFGQLVSTYILCEDMSVPNQFHEALKQVTSYQLEGLELFLVNEKSHKVLTLRKVD